MVNVMQVVQYIQTREENSTLVDQNITSMLISTYKMHIINMVEAFEFEVLEIIDIDDSIKENLLMREQFWIDNLKPAYNILPVAGSNLGYHHTEQTKQKISNSTKGVKKSESHAKHIREGQKSRVLSEEHKAKLSQAAKHRKSQSHHSIINIDGVVYNSIKEASEKTKVKYNTIQRRLKNPNFSNYFYIKYPNKNVEI